MVLKIRLARVAGPGGSKKHAPFYNIVLAQARSARDSKPMEVLGTYDPIPKVSVDAGPGARMQKDIQIDVSRAKYWLGVGAQPTDTAWRLLSMIGLVEPRYLASGEQTQNALAAVRFKTHIPQQLGLMKLLKGYKNSEYAPHNRSAPEDRAEQVDQSNKKSVKAEKDEKSAIKLGEIKGEVTGTTSPQDPNAA